MSYNSLTRLIGVPAFCVGAALLLRELSLLLALLLELPFNWLVGDEFSATASESSKAVTRDNQSTLKASNKQSKKITNQKKKRYKIKKKVQTSIKEFE